VLQTYIHTQLANQADLDSTLAFLQSGPNLGNTKITIV